MSLYSTLSDDELKGRLLEHNVRVGPITKSTRTSWERKLQKLDSDSPVRNQPEGRVSTAVGEAVDDSHDSDIEHSQINELSNEALKAQLIDLGFKPGPINEFTKKVLIKKLMKLKSDIPKTDTDIPETDIPKMEKTSVRKTTPKVSRSQSRKHVAPKSSGRTFAEDEKPLPMEVDSLNIANSSTTAQPDNLAPMKISGRKLPSKPPKRGLRSNNSDEIITNNDDSTTTATTVSRGSGSIRLSSAGVIPQAESTVLLDQNDAVVDSSPPRTQLGTGTVGPRRRRSHLPPSPIAHNRISTGSSSPAAAALKTSIGLNTTSTIEGDYDFSMPIAEAANLNFTDGGSSEASQSYSYANSSPDLMTPSPPRYLSGSAEEESVNDSSNFGIPSPSLPPPGAHFNVHSSPTVDTSNELASLPPAVGQPRSVLSARAMLERIRAAREQQEAEDAAAAAEAANQRTSIRSRRFPPSQGVNLEYPPLRRRQRPNVKSDYSGCDSLHNLSTTVQSSSGDTSTSVGWSRHDHDISSTRGLSLIDTSASTEFSDDDLNFTDDDYDNDNSRGAQGASSLSKSFVNRLTLWCKDINFYIWICWLIPLLLGVLLATYLIKVGFFPSVIILLSNTIFPTFYFSSTSPTHPNVQTMISAVSAGSKLSSQTLKPSEEDILLSYDLIHLLRNKLSTLAGKSECDSTGKAEMSIEDAVMYLKATSDAAVELPERIVEIIQRLLIVYKDWDIVVLDENLQRILDITKADSIRYLLSTAPNKSIICHVTLFISRIFFYLVVLVIVLVGCWLVGYYVVWIYRKQERRRQEITQMIDNITGLLEQQYNNSVQNPASCKPYLPKLHVRDILVPFAQRESKAAVWKEAEDYIDEYESRVRQEVARVRGESHRVWRWIADTTTSMAATDDDDDEEEGGSESDTTAASAHRDGKRHTKPSQRRRTNVRLAPAMSAAVAATASSKTATTSSNYQDDGWTSCGNTTEEMNDEDSEVEEEEDDPVMVPVTITHPNRRLTNAKSTFQSTQNSSRAAASTSRWMGKALPHKKGVTPLIKAPTECVKVKGLFSAKQGLSGGASSGASLQPVVPDDICERIHDDILSKVGRRAQIVHVGISKFSPEACTYIKCQTLAGAAHAYSQLNNEYYDGRLLSVKFLRANKYHERFPDAVHAKDVIQMCPPRGGGAGGDVAAGTTR